MAYSDTLTAEISVDINPKITTAEGSQEGKVSVVHKFLARMVDGSSSGQATGFFGSTFTATTGGITISLADSSDPLGAAGDDTPTSDPEGSKLRCVFVENLDSTNYVSLKKGANGDTNIFSGSTDSVRIDAGGFFLWFSPAGNNAMSDGVDDELLFTADTASVSVKLTYIFG